MNPFDLMLKSEDISKRALSLKTQLEVTKNEFVTTISQMDLSFDSGNLEAADESRQKLHDIVDVLFDHLVERHRLTKESEVVKAQAIDNLKRKFEE